MTQARLKMELQDLQELGLVSGLVKSWEDGRRHDPADARSEVWHFDGRLSDGTTVALAFCLVGVDPADDSVLQTVVNAMITTADGRQSVHAVLGTVKRAEVDTSRCSLPFGVNHVQGDLASYDLHMEMDDGALTLDLRYEALTEAYRPGGTGHVVLGDEEQTFFAALIVARCLITGSIAIDGVSREVTGEGYHDHQWFNSDPSTTWHHWLWGHLYTETHTVVVFELVASESFGFARATMFGVFDAGGKLIFDNLGPAQRTGTTYVEEIGGKELPHRSHYVFGDDRRSYELTFEWVDLLIANDLYASAEDSELGGASQKHFDALGIRPSYARYAAHGTLEVTDPGGGMQESGEMIYEFNYPSAPNSRVTV